MSPLKRRVLSHAALLSIYLLIANIPVWLLNRYICTPRGFFGFEYPIIGALSLFFTPFTAAVLLGLFVVLDIFSAIAITYYFSWQEVVESIRYVGYLPASRLLLYAVCASCMVALIVLSTTYLRSYVCKTYRRQEALLLLLLATSLFFANYTQGRHGLRRDDSIRHSYGIARAPEVNLVLQAARLHWRITPSQTAINSASAYGIQRLDHALANRRPNIVQVLVESWGQSNQAELREGLLAPYSQTEIRQKYHVILGEVPFSGSTVSGETRELCQSTLGLGVMDVRDQGAFRNCLPAQMKSNGYQTGAIHGYSGGMFNRFRWYRAMAFDESWFAKDLHRDGLTDCPGAFPGICDSQIAAWIGDRMLAGSDEKPYFFHWVTLNSHLPVPAKLDASYDASCEMAAIVKQGKALCPWYKLVYKVHESIGSLAARPGLPETVFVVVGDHAPPFGDASLRDDFSQDVVPYVLLIPKSQSELGIAAAD